MNIYIQYVFSAADPICTEVQPDDEVPDWDFSMDEEKMEAGDTFSDNKVQEGSVIHVSSLAVFVVLNYLANKGYKLSKALSMKFDEEHSTDILDALIKMCESTQHSDMEDFFRKLQSDNEAALKNKREPIERSLAGDLGADYDEWSYQMSDLGTVGCDRSYWEAEELYDGDNPNHVRAYRLGNTLVSVLTDIHQSGLIK